jgi:hypothetical protein
MVVVAEPLLEFGPGELACRIDHGTLAVHPLRLDLNALLAIVPLRVV